MNCFWVYNLYGLSKYKVTHGSSMSVFSVYWQLSQGWMADFPAFRTLKSFDLGNHHRPQIKWHNMQHILMYWKYMIILKMCFSVNQIDDLQSTIYLPLCILVIDKYPKFDSVEWTFLNCSASIVQNCAYIFKKTSVNSKMWKKYREA